MARRLSVNKDLKLKMISMKTRREINGKGKEELKVDIEAAEQIKGTQTQEITKEVIRKVNGEKTVEEKEIEE